MPPPVTEPFPVTVTVSWFVVVATKDALTVLSPLRYVAHATDVPLHEPPQPPKKCVLSGCSTTVTVEPVYVLKLQDVAGQLIG